LFDSKGQSAEIQADESDGDEAELFGDRGSPERQLCEQRAQAIDDMDTEEDLMESLENDLENDFANSAPQRRVIPAKTGLPPRLTSKYHELREGGMKIKDWTLLKQLNARKPSTQQSGSSSFAYRDQMFRDVKKMPEPMQVMSVDFTTEAKMHPAVSSSAPVRTHTRAAPCSSQIGNAVLLGKGHEILVAKPGQHHGFKADVRCFRRNLIEVTVQATGDVLLLKADQIVTDMQMPEMSEMMPRAAKRPRKTAPAPPVQVEDDWLVKVAEENVASSAPPNLAPSEPADIFQPLAPALSAARQPAKPSTRGRQRREKPVAAAKPASQSNAAKPHQQTNRQPPNALLAEWRRAAEKGISGLSTTIKSARVRPRL